MNSLPGADPDNQIVESAKNVLPGEVRAIVKSSIFAIRKRGRSSVG